MRTLNVLVCCLMTGAIGFAAADVRAEEAQLLSLNSMLGKYNGRMQIHDSKQKDYDYQVEILNGDKSPEIFSLESNCRNCETKVWKRTNCRIADVQESIKFTCKGKTFEEEYTFKEGALRGSGHTNKWLYSISVTKVTK